MRRLVLIQAMFRCEEAKDCKLAGRNCLKCAYEKMTAINNDLEEDIEDDHQVVYDDENREILERFWDVFSDQYKMRVSFREFEVEGEGEDVEITDVTNRHCDD